jgi:hypothetical protein
MVLGQRHTAKAFLDAIHIAWTDAMELQCGKPAEPLQALELKEEKSTTQTIQERISSLASKATKPGVVGPLLATTSRPWAVSSNAPAPKTLQKNPFGTQEEDRFGAQKKKIN